MKHRMRLGWLGILTALATAVEAATLSVPLIGQEKNNWCWNASCEMALEYYGMNVTQTNMAAWAVGGHNVGNHLSSTTVGPLTLAGSSPPVTYKRRGCGLVLTQFGPLFPTFLQSALTMAQIKDDIDGDMISIIAVRWIRWGWQDCGGHAIVLCGYEGASQVALNDPWPADDNPRPGNPGVAYLVDRSALFSISNTYYGSATVGNRWTQTLKVGRTLDLCFLIDSTGSMNDDISAVKKMSLNMISGLSSNYTDLRLAVVDYRDYPHSPYGESSDWIAKVRTPFTADTNAARAAINALVADGGLDNPEAVFSAVLRMFAGEGIGKWRKNAERRIILMGDSPGHDPEPWDGGHSFADVQADWNALSDKIAVNALYIGANSNAEMQFDVMAGETGGSIRHAADAGDVQTAMNGIIDEFTAKPRYPRDNVKAFRPFFAFEPPVETMGPPVINLLIEIQKWNQADEVWRPYLKRTMNSKATFWKPDSPLPRGRYRWRLGYVRKQGTFMWPSGRTVTMSGGTIMEVGWTRFTRVLSKPAKPVIYTPPYTFYATGSKTVYQFLTAFNARQYAMQIFHKRQDGTWVLWKSMRLNPAKPGAAKITVAVLNHVSGHQYGWRVQSLNYDRPDPVPGAWVGFEKTAKWEYGGETLAVAGETGDPPAGGPAKLDSWKRKEELIGILCSGAPTDDRLQALYLLAERGRPLAVLFLNDADPVIRYEAQRIAGIIPEG